MEKCNCALTGKKLDTLAANPAVCFSVARQEGAVKLHEQRDPCHYFRPDAPDIPLERVKGCATVEIAVTEMTGRREHDREITCWRYTVL
ncbi:MAG: hypothetical protein JXA89_15240 [Anaerolineae bacterium]|nr:hypothetical protein [Anaerolineae bacterium]